MVLSVIICTYNRGKYLPMVLNSLETQTLPKSEFEILLINNNSPDDTDRIIQEYISISSLRIRYCIEYNQGISYARNRGVNESKGEIIVFLDDDETVEADFLSNIKDFFEDYQDAGITAGPVIPVFETNKPQWLSPYIERAITGKYEKGNKIKKLPPRDYPGTGHACFRKRLFDQYGDFKTNLGRKGNSLMGAEDKDFFLRLMNGNENCYYLPGARIYHHIPAEKLTDSFFQKITYAMGKSERVRTINLGRKKYYKRLLQELFKWGASVILWIGYLITLSPQKGNKIIEFRYNLTKGLIGL